MKWEYKIVREFFSSKGEAEDELNFLGEQGWEALEFDIVRENTTSEAGYHLTGKFKRQVI